METSMPKYFVIALIVIALLAGTGVAYAYKVGWKNGYIVAKNGEFRQLSVSSVQDIRALKIAKNPREIQKTTRLNLNTKLEQMSFIDDYISRIEEKGVTFRDIESLSEIEFQGKKINSRQARVEEINRLRAAVVKGK